MRSLGDFQESEVTQEPLPLKQKVPLRATRRFTKPPHGQQALDKNKEKKIFCVNPFLRFAKATDVFTELSVLRAGVPK